MSAIVLNNDTPELAEAPDYRCFACGMSVRKVVSFSGYGNDWQACFDCVDEAHEAREEADDTDDDEPPVADPIDRADPDFPLCPWCMYRADGVRVKTCDCINCKHKALVDTKGDGPTKTETVK